MERARSIGMTTIAVLGGNGGAIKDLCDVAVVVPSSDVQRIQETHIALGHILCQSVELILYPILQTNQSHA
jgi:D-sedoheptulose 7-phosphate isomerase